MSSLEVFYPKHSEIYKLPRLIEENKLDEVNNRLKGWLRSSNSPFTTAVYIFKKLIKSKLLNSVCTYVIKQIRLCNTEQINISNEDKIQLVEIVYKFNEDNIKFMINVFRLDQLDLIVLNTIAKHCFEKVNTSNFFNYLEFLKLINAEFINDIFLPMISRGRLKVPLRYAANSEKNQISLMESVDRYIGELLPNKNTLKYGELYENLFNFAKESKRRFPNAYSETKLENCEAFIEITKQNAKSRKVFMRINYLFKQWKNKRMASSSLESLVYRLVGNNPGLLEGVACLVENEYNDKVKADLLRQSKQPGSERTPIWSDEDEIPIRDHELKLDVPIKNVFFVDSLVKLKKCRNYFNRSKPPKGEMLPVGFDSEWVIDPSKKFPEDLAVIQLAINDRVYLIDFLYFNPSDIELLEKFFKFVFRSRFFLILGFSLFDDKKVLSRYFGRETLWNWYTHPIDFLKFRSCDLFPENCVENSIACPHTGKLLTGLSNLCYQVEVYCLVILS